MNHWQLQQAKAQLSTVVKQAMKEGPQEISLRGQPAVVVISKADYEKLIKPKSSFVAFMRHSPLVGIELHLRRDQSKVRDIDL